jgi:aminoglycoside 6'-N-acetyltransferase
MMINLRSATLADLSLLRHWDKQAHVVAADPNDDWGWEVELTRTPDWREQLIAEIPDRPIGFIQIKGFALAISYQLSAFSQLEEVLDLS